MKALVLDAPQALRFDTVPDPIVTAEAVLVRVHAAGISESDLLTYNGALSGADDPLVLGHEIAGTIVGGSYDGTRVVVNPVVTCGTCSACATGRTNICADLNMVSTPTHAGGLAEYVTVPCRNVIQLPDDVPFTTACLIDPLARGWHVARMSRRAFPRGRQALVIGRDAVGVGAKLALKAQGIDDVLIADETFQTDAEFDIIIDVVGTEASQKLASKTVATGGVVGLVEQTGGAKGLDLGRLSDQEATVMCTTAYTAQDFVDTAGAAFDGRLGPLDWAVIRPMDKGPETFADIAAGRIDALRVVLAPDAG